MTVLPFPGVRAPTTPIAHYLRIGHSGHLQLGLLQAKGRFPARRVVFNASRLKFQKDLVSALKAAGCEIVLDTDAAELSALARFDGMASTAPWATIEEIPDQARTRHFLDNDMAQADRLARQVKELKIADQELLKRLAKHSHRIESMRATLEHLSEALGYTASRARAAIKRDAKAGGDK